MTEFLFKYTAEINHAFVAFLRLFEIQDTLSQISHLNNKPLVGYSDLPTFISSHLSAKLSIDPSLRLTITALEKVCQSWQALWLMLNMMFRI